MRRGIQIVFVAWWVGMIIATSIPGEHIPQDVFTDVSRGIHFLLYFVFTILFWIVMEPHSKRSKWWTPLRAVLFLVVYASLDEVHQLFIPGRHASMADFYANCAGIATALVVLATVHRLLQLKKG
ncbi:VanZ family protein [Chitinivibrio alkaliphilus]|uniref:VanZ-like domain-containing protein n=1 Tax=Chitinivibrio alkaliphilus ACht1 TaxID=1313304 RepID=U7D434_9BACT|nr:VanZ family protein [Chitinivibrio alkaliphilus]ERP31279.1 hypothetical protein CALK_1768 [Chitinivibrio alkaliphilus ACht1]